MVAFLFGIYWERSFWLYRLWHNHTPPNIKTIDSNAFEHWYNAGTTYISDIKDLPDDVLYSMSPVPPVCMPNQLGKGPFSWINIDEETGEYYLMDYRHTRLYVPMGSKSAYEKAFGWGYEYFEEIVEVEDVMTAAKEAIATEIHKIKKDEDTPAWEVARYNLQGQYLSRPVKGLNIIRYSDGSVRKEYIR